VASWNRFVALGDSLTEGYCDPLVGPDAPWSGWAVRLAAILDGNAKLRAAPFGFADLGVAGQRIRTVVQQEVPRAIELKADLVSLLVGSSDLLSRKSDPDALAADIESGIAALRHAGCDVLLATSFDPRQTLFLKPLRSRAAVFNANLWSIARTHGTFTLDLWGVRDLQARTVWSRESVQLSAEGHRLLALRAAHALGIPYFELSGEGATATSPHLIGVGPRR
jgi:lysophospholipase L1-like esterase